jgi:putative transferase (TIGR04331 family)
VATNDSYSWIWASHNDRWNGEVYSRILEKKRVNGLVVEKIIDHETEFQYRSNIKNVKNKSILKELLKKVNALASYLSKKQKYFIKDSYLSRWHEFLLSMSFYQIPVVWRSRDYSINNNVDYDIRNAICSEFENNFDDECLKIIGGMLFEMMPVCYLEGFEELLNITERQSWPTSPKLIFTSNSFDTDEVFKLWTAQAVKDGSKYVVGQHGNNYGTHRYMNPSVEEQTADKFLTWGWSDGLSSHKPAFVFKNQKKYKKLYNSKGGLLLIEVCGPHRINTADESYEFNNYLRDQQNFVGLLDKRLLSELTVRLHAGYVYTKWRDDVLWSNFNSTIKIDKGTSQIRELISKSRLIVHGYDSTGMLESLERNIPTIAFWSGGLDHLRDSAIPFYNHLINAGIVHLSSESAAQHVNKIWNDVDGWWKSKPVQVAKEMFCAKYAQSSKAPVRHLKQILEECCE